MVTRYQKRISGPLMDRIDLCVDVPWVEYEKLTTNSLDDLEQEIEGPWGCQIPIEVDHLAYHRSWDSPPGRIVSDAGINGYGSAGYLTGSVGLKHLYPQKDKWDP